MLRAGGLCWLRCWSEELFIGSRGGRGLCAAAGGNGNKAVEPPPPPPAEGMTKEEAYRKIHDLDFTTAARILFTAAPDKKKFGCVQQLSACFFFSILFQRSPLLEEQARFLISRLSFSLLIVIAADFSEQI